MFSLLSNRLKKHYLKFTTARFYRSYYYPAHTLHEQHRHNSTTTTTFQDLSREDQTLVREGTFCFDFLFCLC